MLYLENGFTAAEPRAVLLFPIELSGWHLLCRAYGQVLFRWGFHAETLPRTSAPPGGCCAFCLMPLQPKLQTRKKSPGHLRRACSCQEESAWHGIEQTHSESGSKLNQHWPGHCQLGLLILGPGGRSPVPSLEVLCRCCQGPRVLSCGAFPSGVGVGRWRGGSYRPAQLYPEAMLPKAARLLTRNL